MESTTGPYKDYFAARAQNSRNNINNAILLYTDAINQNIDTPIAYYRLAYLLGEINHNVEQATLTCEKAVGLFPSDYSCYGLLATLYTRIGETNRAISWLERGLKEIKNPSYLSAVYQQIGFIELANGDLEEAALVTLRMHYR